MKIFLKVGAVGAVQVVGCLVVLVCPLVAGGQAFEASGPAEGWLWSSGRVFLDFVRFLALLAVHCLEIWLISRF